MKAHVRMKRMVAISVKCKKVNLTSLNHHHHLLRRRCRCQDVMANSKIETERSSCWKAEVSKNAIK
jgi:hypothetical protein